MAQILLQFDLRLPLDVKERYPNFCKLFANSPPVSVIQRLIAEQCVQTQAVSLDQISRAVSS